MNNISTITILCQNFLHKVSHTWTLDRRYFNDSAKYRPTACLPTAYKIFIACLAAAKIRQHRTNNNIIHKEQNVCRNKAFGCKEQVVIDLLMIMEQAKKNNRKLCTAYIDYWKDYDSVPHIWLVKSLQIYKYKVEVRAI